MSLLAASAYRMGNLVVNPSGTSPTATETYLRGPAWAILEMADLWNEQMRGENALIPHAPGKKAYPRILDEGTYVLPFTVVGDCDRAGNATATNNLDQLDDNWRWLKTHVQGPTDGVTSTRVLKITYPDGSSAVAAGQMRLTIVKQRGTILDVVLDITVPAGRFV
jgi:hypothetical protein